MRIAIFGAGAIGTTLAALLARAGFTVSVVARGEHLSAMQRQGIKLTTPREEFVVRVIASADTRQLGQQDLVFCTLKAYSLPQAAPDILPLLGDNTPVIFAQNGLPWWYFEQVNQRDLREMIDLKRVIGCVVQCPATLVAPGEIRLANHQINFILGEITARLTPRLNEIKAQLQDALPITLTDQIHHEIWKKLRINVASSLLTLLTQSYTADILNHPALKLQFQQLLEETRAVAAYYGVDIAPVDEAQLASLGAQRHAPSMLQDLLAHRPLEIDAQLQILHRLGQKADVATPLLDILLPILQQRARASVRL